MRQLQLLTIHTDTQRERTGSVRACINVVVGTGAKGVLDGSPHEAGGQSAEKARTRRKQTNLEKMILLGWSVMRGWVGPIYH